MAKANKKNTKKLDAAAAAALRARRTDETDAEYAARIAAIDAEDGDQEEAEDGDGLIQVRAITGFTHHTGVSAAQIEAQRIMRPGESPEQHVARMGLLDKVEQSEPLVVTRGRKLRVTPDDGAKLARLGLVLIGDGDEFLGDAGPKVLAEAGLVRNTNG